MTTLLQKAVEKATALPGPEQDALAQLMLLEMESENKWDALFAKSPQKLKQLGDKAWAEHEAGLTLPLDPETL